VTITVGAVRSSRPDLLSMMSRRLEDARRAVQGIVELVLWRRPTGPRWSGAASSAAADRYAVVVATLARVAGSIAVCAQALSHASLRLSAALDLVRQADRRAAGAGAWVDHDGQLYLPVRGSTGDPVRDSYVARQDELMRDEVKAYLAEAVRVASRTDVELASDLLAAARGEAGGTGTMAHVGPVASLTGVLSVVPPPHAAGDVRAAYAASAWWRSLTNEERGRVIVEHPEWVGPRDGLPSSARHEANLVLLDRAECAARARVRSADAGATPWNASERTQAAEQLADLVALREVLARRDGLQRRLLLVDTRGQPVKAVLSLGDIDRAEHVTTFVGGFTTTVRGDLARYDDDFRRLRADGREIARGHDLAVVTWMGYDAPQLVETITSVDRNVLSATVARDNAEALARFVTGVEASRDKPVHQTLWAHSYGAVLAGFAMLHASAIDDVAVLGAPGLPFSDLSATGLKPGSLNVLGALADDVADYGWIVHGTKAADVAGGVRLSTFALKDPGTGCNHWLRPRSDFVDMRRTSVGHSDYLRDGTDSARNLVALSVRRRDLLVVQGADERQCTTTGPNLGLLDPLRWPRPIP
jgi:hypothetical protein